MRDYIMSRESLKRHCKAMCKKYKDVPTSGTYSEHRLVLDLLEQTRWIPVSERLPKVADCYAVTRKIGSDLITSVCFFDGTNTWYNDNQINRERNYLTNIVAWMPLPEPYRESEE